jgi:hypothetical protein
VLEAELKRLEAEYNMFFAGRLPRLPWEQRSRVETLMKRHDRAPLLNTGERFRFNTLQTRFAKFCELWERQLATLEGARPGARRPRGGAPPPSSRPAPIEPSHPAAEASTPRRDTPKLVAVANLHDTASQHEKVQALYEKLVEARQSVGQPAVAYERFEELVRAQLSKFGGGEVSFRVVLKDGKVSLTAKADGTE